MAADVLVIDDSEIARQSMERTLNGAGLTVVTLGSPIGATSAILRNDVQVVVIDVHMPSMRGNRLAALFRKNPRFGHLGLILVSSEPEDKLRRLAEEAEADDIVCKSSVAEDLVPAVLRLMERS